MALEHKTGILPQKAGKGYVSGMMVFEFFSPVCQLLLPRPGQIF